MRSIHKRWISNGHFHRNNYPSNEDKSGQLSCRTGHPPQWSAKLYPSIKVQGTNYWTLSRPRYCRQLVPHLEKPKGSCRPNHSAGLFQRTSGLKWFFSERAGIQSLRSRFLTIIPWERTEIGQRKFPRTWFFSSINLETGTPPIVWSWGVSLVRFATQILTRNLVIYSQFFRKKIQNLVVISATVVCAISGNFRLHVDHNELQLHKRWQTPPAGLSWQLMNF